MYKGWKMKGVVDGQVAFYCQCRALDCDGELLKPSKRLLVAVQ
jgi:hypothetical protein